MRFRWTPISFAPPLPRTLSKNTHTHTHTGYITRQQSDSSHLCILWCISVQIRFSDLFQKKPMNLWADDSQELGGIIQNIQLLRFNPSSLVYPPYGPLIHCPSTDVITPSIPSASRTGPEGSFWTFFCANSKHSARRQCGPVGHGDSTPAIVVPGLPGFTFVFLHTSKFCN